MFKDQPQDHLRKVSLMASILLAFTLGTFAQSSITKVEELILAVNADKAKCVIDDVMKKYSNRYPSFN